MGLPSAGRPPESPPDGQPGRRSGCAPRRGARADLRNVDAIGGHGRATKTDRPCIRAGLAALDGQRADAFAPYRDALRAWRDLGPVWDEALCGLDMATLLDPAEPEVRAAADRAREILEGLGAWPFLDRLAAAMTRSSEGAGHSAVLPSTASVTPA